MKRQCPDFIRRLRVAVSNTCKAPCAPSKAAIQAYLSFLEGDKSDKEIPAMQAGTRQTATEHGGESDG